MKRIGSNVVPLQMALLVVMVTACAVTAGRASAQQTPSSLGPMVPMISPKGCRLSGHAAASRGKVSP